MLPKLWVCQFFLFLHFVCGISAVQKKISKRELLAPRQLNRHELVRRLAKKEARKAALEKKNKKPKRTDTGIQPRASGSAIGTPQTCSTTDVGSGFALYAGVGPLGIDALVKVTVGSRAICANLCVSSSLGCSGYVYGGTSGKSCALVTGERLVSASLGLSAIWDTYLVGDCASNKISRDCCNSKAYPICSSNGLGQGWATYRNYASPGNAILTTVLTPILGFLGSVLGTVTSLLVEVDVPTVADCRNKCNNTSGCVGFEYNGGKCGIKQNSDRVLRKLRPDRQKSTFVGGTCAQNAKITSAICCDSS